MVSITWMWIFLDSTQPDAEASWEFWRSVTDCTLSARRGERDEFATLLPKHGDPWLKVQVVRSGGGVHLDLDVEHPNAAADIAESLGAQVISRHSQGTLVLLRSPGGQTFCFTKSASHRREQRREGLPELLDQVCFDLPEEVYDAEASFWSELTGWQVDTSDVEGFERLRRPHGIPVRVLLQRLGEARGPVRAHVDFAAVDRSATVSRHLAAGAHVVEEGAQWTVLRDPAGRDYCVTDRSPV